MAGHEPLTQPQLDVPSHSINVSIAKDMVSSVGDTWAPNNVSVQVEQRHPNARIIAAYNASSLP